MPSPLISIITPTYNSIKDIEYCLRIVASQTYEDKEHIIIDGGSTDGTIEVVRAYADKYPHILWISEKDKGIYDAMNKGIKLANGEWIYFLGGDDFLYDNILINIPFESFEGVDVIYGNVLFGDKVVHGEFDHKKLAQTTIPHQAIFYKKRLFEEFGNYQINFKSQADYYFNIKLFCNQNVNWLYIDKLICKYNDGGYSAGHFDDAFVEEIENIFKTYFKNYISKEEFYKGMRWAAYYHLKYKNFFKGLEILFNSGSLFSQIPDIAYSLKLRVRNLFAKYPDKTS